MTNESTELYQGQSIGYRISNIRDPQGLPVSAPVVTAILVNADGTEEVGNVVAAGDTYYVEFEPSQRGYAHIKLAAVGDNSAWKQTYMIRVKRF